MKRQQARTKKKKKKILQLFISNEARTIIITFDRYFTLSIKDNEHILRGMVKEQRQYRISGAEQVRHTDFATEFEVIDNRVVKTFEHDLSCPEHEEADTKIVFHVAKLQDDGSVFIRCSDTDVLIILLGNAEFFDINLTTWMHVGVGNNQWYINVTKLYEKLGKDLCASLPAFHAFKGCDFNPAFFRKGKKRPFTTLQSSEKYIRAFTDLGAFPNCVESTLAIIEEFLCQIYGSKQIKFINETRLALFSKAYKFTDDEKHFHINAKNFDVSNLPPCQSELRQHLLRTAYIAKLWRNSHLQIPTTLSPIEHGWKECDGMYDYKWFEGDQLPNEVSDIIIESEENTDKVIIHVSV